jgi:hypothetical protein
MEPRKVVASYADPAQGKEGGVVIVAVIDDTTNQFRRQELVRRLPQHHRISEIGV